VATQSFRSTEPIVKKLGSTTAGPPESSPKLRVASARFREVIVDESKTAERRGMNDCNWTFIRANARLSLSIKRAAHIDTSCVLAIRPEVNAQYKLRSSAPNARPSLFVTRSRV
jgi:hypothetical protein